MSLRWLFVAFVSLTLVVSGCSKPTITHTPANTTAATSSSKATSSEETTSVEAQAPQDTLDPDACVEVTSANLDLAVANNAEQAQAAADTFGKYDPPASVQEAIDHFVGTGGAQFDDPDYDEYNKRIEAWVKAVCPL